MNQKRNLTSINSLRKPRFLLAGGLGWLSSISLLSTGVAFAQTASPPESTPPPDGVPSAEDLLDSELESLSAPLQVPSIEPDITAAPIPETVAPYSEGDLEPALEPTLELEEGTIANPSSPPLISPDLVEDAEAAFEPPSVTNTGSYIDPTPYTLGATEPGKPDVILSERSTGCQVILQPTQDLPGSVCPPSPQENLFAGGSAGAGYSDAAGYSDPGYNPSSLSVFSLQAAASASARDFYNLTVRPPARLSNGNANLLFPLSIPAAITSAFGWRMHPIMGDARFHSGTDIGAPQGTPVIAAFNGKVDIADFVGGYGLTVVLQHNKGTEQTLYAHLSEIFVSPGDEVKQGEVIGRVGSTGLSTGPHLHFEFRQLTQEGWVVRDAGGALEYALANFVQGLQVAQTNSKVPMLAVFQNSGKALRVTKQSKPEAQIVGQSEDLPNPEEPDATF